MQTVEFDNKDSADPGPHNVREIVNLQTENTGEAFGKPRGFGWQDVGAILPPS